MPPTKNMLLRLDPALAEQLQAIADVEGRPVSEVAREAIRVLVDHRRGDAAFQRKVKATARAQRQVLDRLRGEGS